jgi:CRISPR system Cascade subunit CasA
MMVFKVREDSPMNLIDDPWLPCIMTDGTAKELSLSVAMVGAQEVREVFDQSPLVTVALHRLMLAILHRNFGPASVGEWLQLWRRGQWNEETLTAYFAQWHERFELFHPDRPFYQVPEVSDVGRQPISVLFQELASGNNTTLFDHSYERAPIAFTPAQAARALVARQSFSVGFGKSSPFYFSDSPLIRGFTVLVVGNNLFETLALNLALYDRDNPIAAIPGAEDRPVWERDALEAPRKEGTAPNGYLDYLTWQSRRIHLYAEGDPPVVRQCQLQQGLKLADPPPEDPFKCYRTDPKRGRLPVSFREERALWRDSHALFEAAGQRPEIFNWLAQLREAAGDGLKPSYRFAAFGLVTDEGKAASVTLWRHEQLPLPLAYLENSDPSLLTDLRGALEYAEDIGRELRGAAWTFAKTLFTSPETVGEPRREAVEPVARSLAPERRFWPNLEVPFLQLMTKLPTLEASDRSAEIFRWRAQVRGIARRAMEETVRDLNTTKRALRAVAVAEREFNRSVMQTLEGDESL